MYICLNLRASEDRNQDADKTKRSIQTHHKIDDSPEALLGDILDEPEIEEQQSRAHARTAHNEHYFCGGICFAGVL